MATSDKITKKTVSKVKAEVKKATETTKAKVKEKIESNDKMKNLKEKSVTYTDTIKSTKNKVTTNNKKFLGKLIGVLIGLALFIGLTTLAVYTLDKNAKKAVRNHFADNDYRRGEAINLELDSKKVTPDIVVTDFNINKPVYSLIYSNPFDQQQSAGPDGVTPKEQQLVEVNYLKREGFNYKVKKSYRVVVLGDKDSAIDKAKKMDLHIDNPDMDKKEIINLEDLDKPESQRLTKDQSKQKLLDNKKEIEEVKKVLEEGKREYQGQPLPENVTKEALNGYLDQINKQLEKFN
jgi:hypothetical protein